MSDKLSKRLLYCSGSALLALTVLSYSSPTVQAAEGDPDFQPARSVQTEDVESDQADQSQDLQPASAEELMLSAEEESEADSTRAPEEIGTVDLAEIPADFVLKQKQELEETDLAEDTALSLRADQLDPVEIPEVEADEGQEELSSVAILDADEENLNQTINHSIASDLLSDKYSQLYRFASDQPDKFNQTLATVTQMLDQNEGEETSADVLNSFYQIFSDDEISPELLNQMANFYWALDDIRLNQATDGVELEEPVRFVSYSADSTEPSKGLDDFKKALDKITSTTDSVLSLVEGVQAGEVSGAAIGGIIDSVLPIDLGFSKIGGLIQRIAELKAQATRDDVMMATEIVGAIAELVPSEVTVNGTPVNYVIGKLGNMAQDIGLSVADGMVRFFHPGTFYNTSTFRLRGQVAALASRAIHIATTEWRYKPQIIHSKAGLEITHAFMSVVDPYSTVDRLTQRLAELKEMIDFGFNYRDITALDIATTYIKEDLDRAIWDIRKKRDEYILSKVPFEIYHDLNRAITKAVGVQLWGETRVFEVDQAIENLNQAYQSAWDYLNAIPLEEQIAPNSLKRELNDLIWQVRRQRDQFVLGNVSFQSYNQLNQVITQAVGLQLNLKAKTVDVQNIMSNLQSTLAEAKEEAETYLAQQSSREDRLGLRDLIAEVRSIRDQELLGQVSFDLYNQLNQTITQAVGVRLNLFATKAEVQQAEENLKQAVQNARFSVQADLERV